jgi:hypothetical protein
MVHLLVSYNGTRFTFLHDFGHLLLSQLEATLEGCPIDIRVRTTKVDGETYLWPDSNHDDHIHRPLLLEDMSSYELAMQYKKVIKSEKAIKENFEFHNSEPPNAHHNDEIDNDGNSVGSNEVTVHLNPIQDNLNFLPLHPGSCFTKLLPLKNWVVLMMYYNGARICSIFKLRIRDDECDDNTHDQ